MQILEQEVIDNANTKVAEIAYKVSGKINTELMEEEIYIGSKIVKLLRVINSEDSLLTNQQKQTILISINQLINL